MTETDFQQVTAQVVSAESWNQLSDEHKTIVRDLAVESDRYASGLTIELGKEAMIKVAACGAACLVTSVKCSVALRRAAPSCSSRLSLHWCR